MTKILVLILMTLLLLTESQASKSAFTYQPMTTSSQLMNISAKILFNNKEASSHFLSKNDIQLAKKWATNISIPSENELDELMNLFLEKVLEDFNDSFIKCDVKFIHFFINEAKERNLAHSYTELRSLVHYLRFKNNIDDILYRAIERYLEMNEHFKYAQKIKVKKSSNQFIKRLKKQNIKIKDIFSIFQSNNICFFENYETMLNRLHSKKYQKKSFLNKLFQYAFSQKEISRDIFHKLMTLNKIQNLKQKQQRHIRINQYLETLSGVKDLYSKNNEDMNQETTYPNEIILSQERISRREYLYRKFTINQIIILSHLLLDTSKRINAKNSQLVWTYANNENDIYIFSPMEQYRASIKLLRKEIAEVRRSQLFRYTSFQYEDIVSAAFETGVIKAHEIDYIIKFKHYWQPQKSPGEAYLNLALTLTGNAVFFLPPPWNTIGALGLIWGEIIFKKKKKVSKPEDNENVII